MGDHYYGSISIPECNITPEVKNVIEEEECLEFDGIVEGIACYHHESARYGMFEELESKLIEMGIPFDRYSSSYCEYEAVNFLYRPAVDDRPEVKAEVYQGHDSGPYVTTANLKPLLDLSPEECQERLKALIEEKDPPVISLQDWIKQYGPKGE